jgi:hypothetical protein
LAEIYSIQLGSNVASAEDLRSLVSFLSDGNVTDPVAEPVGRILDGRGRTGAGPSARSEAVVWAWSGNARLGLGFGPGRSMGNAFLAPVR